MQNMEFLTDMSHELRTPLNAIIGFSEMLINGDYSKCKQERYLNNIAVSGKHMLNLVNGILDVSLVDSGKMFVDYERFESGEIIKEVINVLESMAEKKNISIKTNLKEVVIEADEKKFRQILYNLINNSIKYTENNGAILVKSTVKKGLLSVEVKDTGIGIPEKDYNKVFERFSQINPEYSKGYGSTGLGLSLTKTFVEAHKGNIYFKSIENKGTTFWFNIPIERKENYKNNDYMIQNERMIC